MEASWVERIVAAILSGAFLYLFRRRDQRMDKLEDKLDKSLKLKADKAEILTDEKIKEIVRETVELLLLRFENGQLKEKK